MNSNKNVVAKFFDKYGEEREIHDTRHGLTVKRRTDTLILQIGKVVARLIGEKVKTQRLTAGLALEELCVKAGLSSVSPKSRMWEIENNTRTNGIRLGTLYALAMALDIPVNKLLPTINEVGEYLLIEEKEISVLAVGENRQGFSK